jgi:imidazoleglycerol-phosphate dehydratase/histidinol-phosphatase
MKKKALFIDRDGTLIAEPPDEQIDAFEKLVFLPGVFEALRKVAQSGMYELVLVTNQDGLGTDSFPEDTFWPVHRFVMSTLAAEGIVFSAEHIDKTFPHQGAPTRKPGTGMLTQYMDGSYDLAGSFVIGDRITDVQLAENLGSASVLIGDKKDPRAALCSNSWHEIADFLLRQGTGRQATVKRSTNETAISIGVNLDGSGQFYAATGIGFFDHMLEQLARHAQIDLKVEVKGDLHIDEHHTIEDTALTLGEAFAKALGDKRGINRYGHFLLPMDEALAQVAIDFSGRPWLVWEAGFKREKVGGMPVEMFEHFFKSFSDTAKCNLNIKVNGHNEHHQIEAIFKAWAKAIRMAVKKEGSHNEIPSTKGSL